MNNVDKTNDLLRNIVKLASSEKKKSGFLIGNTTKINKEGFFFTPLRNTSHMVVGGVIVFSEKQAIEITRMVDGKVDYVLVDAEKKVVIPISLPFVSKRPPPLPPDENPAVVLRTKLFSIG